MGFEMQKGLGSCTGVGVLDGTRRGQYLTQEATERFGSCLHQSIWHPAWGGGKLTAGLCWDRGHPSLRAGPVGRVRVGDARLSSPAPVQTEQ